MSGQCAVRSAQWAEARVQAWPDCRERSRTSYDDCLPTAHCALRTAI
jgi:hypothetical protein